MPSRRIGGLRVWIYFNDHRPPHVHVQIGNSEVVFSLSVDGEPIGIREIRGNVKNGEVERALEMVRQNNDSLLEWWREIHGDC